MTYLLDVNLLIALFDPYHVHHPAAHQWFAGPAERAWATCPMTETGFVRIVGSPHYPNSAGSATAALDVLRERTTQPGHRFWADDISLLQRNVWKFPERASSAHISDCYLLALATHRRGKLATFDRRIPADLLPGGRESLLVLP